MLTRRSFLAALSYLPLVGPLISRRAALVNVRDFGARGDGITDDRFAFESAVQYANEHAQFTKDGTFTVYIPRGTYNLSEPIKIGTNTITGSVTVE